MLSFSYPLRTRSLAVVAYTPHLFILTDSQVSCDWAERTYPSKSEIAKVLVEKLAAISLKGGVPIRFSHRRRQFNQAADTLSKADISLFKGIVTAMLDGPCSFVELDPPALDDNTPAMDRAIDCDASVGISHLEREFIWSSLTPTDLEDAAAGTPPQVSPSHGNALSVICPSSIAA